MLTAGSGEGRITLREEPRGTSTSPSLIEHEAIAKQLGEKGQHNRWAKHDQVRTRNAPKSLRVDAKRFGATSRPWDGIAPSIGNAMCWDELPINRMPQGLEVADVPRDWRVTMAGDIRDLAAGCIGCHTRQAGCWQAQEVRAVRTGNRQVGGCKCGWRRPED